MGSTNRVNIPHPLHRSRILCKLDPQRLVLEFQERRVKFDVDLKKYLDEEQKSSCGLIAEEEIGG